MIAQREPSGFVGKRKSRCPWGAGGEGKPLSAQRKLTAREEERRAAVPRVAPPPRPRTLPAFLVPGGARRGRFRSHSARCPPGAARPPHVVPANSRRRAPTTLTPPPRQPMRRRPGADVTAAPSPPAFKFETGGGRQSAAPSRLATPPRAPHRRRPIGRTQPRPISTAPGRSAGRRSARARPPAAGQWEAPLGEGGPAAAANEGARG